MQICSVTCMCAAGLAVGLDPEGYGNPDFCWISMYDKLMWSFAGPVSVVILVLCSSVCLCCLRHLRVFMCLCNSLSGCVKYCNDCLNWQISLFTDEWWDVFNGPAYDMQPHSEGDKEAARDVSTTCMCSGTINMESGRGNINLSSWILFRWPQKMKVLSSFTHLQIVPNLYEFLSYAKNKRRCFKTKVSLFSLHPNQKLYYYIILCYVMLLYYVILYYVILYYIIFPNIVKVILVIMVVLPCMCF